MTIYFVRMEGLPFIKIGYTAGQPERRMAQLQTGQPNKLVLVGAIPGSKADERSLHKEFSEYHQAGEWFEAVPAVSAAIAVLIASQGPWYLARRSVAFAKLEAMWADTFGSCAHGADDDCPVVRESREQLSRAAAELHRLRVYAAETRRRGERLSKEFWAELGQTIGKSPAIKYLDAWVRCPTFDAPLGI